MIVHAIGESVLEKVPSGTYACVLGVPNEDELLRVASQLEKSGLGYVLIREPDAPFNGAATAIGITPVEKSKVKKITGRLPLLGRNNGKD